jgi:hypothetical protein
MQLLHTIAGEFQSLLGSGTSEHPFGIVPVEVFEGNHNRAAFLQQRRSSLEVIESN